MPLRFFEVYVYLLVALWLWMIIDCILTRHLKTREKIIWLLVILFSPPIGPLIYFCVGFLGRIIRNFILKRSSHRKSVIPKNTYPLYEQGYQRTQMNEDDHEQSEYLAQNQHEEPRTLYPEMKQINNE